MKTFEEQCQILYNTVVNRLHEIIDDVGVKSKSNGLRTLEIDNDDFMFNIGHSYLYGIQKENLVTESDYYYSYAELSLIQLCKIVDYYGR